MFIKARYFFKDFIPILLTFIAERSLMIYNNNMNFCSKNKEIWLLIAISIAMFFVYSYLPLSQINWQKQNNIDLSLRFNSPDEVLNYYFSQQLVESGQLYYFEPLNISMARVVFPRWALVMENKITPGGFLGLDLIYGSLGQIFTKNVLPFLTPFFAVLGVIFFYLLVKIFFDKKIAFVSALLMFICPGFWYYASRTMFNNILFLSFLIMGLYFFIKLLQKNHYTLYIIQYTISILAGLFLGLALIVRSSEVVWVSLMVVATLIFYRKNFKNFWPYLLISLGLAVCCLAPVLNQNKILYGNYFSTGYPLTTVSSNLETNSVQTISPWRAILLPFGLNLKNIFFVVYNYIFKLFWPFVLLALAGIILFLKKEKSREQKLFFCLLLITFYLLIYYGSWIFHDSIIPNLISVGSSYVRYFLPLYIFSLPLMAILLVKIWQWKKLTKALKIFLFIPITYYLLFNVYNAVFGGPESLLAVKNNLITYNIQAQSILKIVPQEAVLLLDDSADKIVFPELKHIIVPQGGVEYAPLRRALTEKIAPSFYYFHNKASDNPEYLNQTKFNSENLEIYDGKNINGGGVIYKIKLKN